MANWRPHERGSDEHADRPSLEAVLEHYGVQLRSTRNTQMILCPLGHEERSPSCSVRLDDGLWNCHSCGQGGDAFTLIMRKEGVDFGRARTIATNLGLPTDGTGPGGQSVSGSSYAGRRAVPKRPGANPGGGGYKPSWRRK